MEIGHNVKIIKSNEGTEVYIDGMKIRGLLKVEFYDAWDEFPYVDIKFVPATINAEKEKAEEKEIKLFINGQSIAQCATEALDK